MNNNSLPSWGIMNPNHPNSCTCDLPVHKTLLYYRKNGHMITELVWTKKEVSMQPYCPYHSMGGEDYDTMFQSGYSDPISGTLQSIVNQATIPSFFIYDVKPTVFVPPSDTMTFEDVVPCSYFESFDGLDDVQPLTAKTMVSGDDWIDNLHVSLDQIVLDSPEKEIIFFSGENIIVISDDDDEYKQEEIIEDLKEAKKNKMKKKKKKAPTKKKPRTSVYHDQFETRKRDKDDERIAQFEKFISNDNQKNKELDGVVDHLKIMQTQMNGTNTPLPPPPPPATRTTPTTVRVRPVPIIPKMPSHFYRFLCGQSWPMAHEKYVQMIDFYFRN